MDKKQKIIIGLTGTHGSGKGTVVEYLKQVGFRHFSARELLRNEILKRGLPQGRESYHNLANEWRMRYGPEYVAFSLYEAARGTTSSSVLESIYTVAEIEKIRKEAKKNKEKFLLIAVDAEEKIRYERIYHRRRSETDNVTFEQFVIEERKEMASDDPHKHNLVACREKADIVLTNNGTQEEFFKQIKEKLGL